MRESLKCIVIDDEPIGRELIEGFVHQTPFLELSETFGEPLKALAYLQNYPVDIIFTDIEMPQLNGLELVRTLTNAPVIIFITAHRDFALDGFETGAADYLVKPVRFDRFLKAVNRAKDYIGYKTNEILNEKADRIFIKSEGKLVKILFRDILYLEAQGDYIKIVTQDATFTTLMTLKSMEEILSPPDFCRIQRSFIVKISAVKALNGNMVELKNGKNISFALNKKEELYNLLGVI